MVERQQQRPLATPGERTPPSVVIAAGGTGGHIYPGLALAEAIRAADPRARVRFVGTVRGLETRLIPEAGYPLDTVDMIPFARSLGPRRFLLPAALAKAGWQCRQVLSAAHATVAVGMGGYASAPLIAGARLASVPSVVHESNAVPGRANRLSATLTPNVAVAMRSPTLPRHARLVGMPLDGNLANFDRTALRGRARSVFGVAEDEFLLLVNGGSQGADRLTEAAVDLALRYREHRNLRIVIKVGSGKAHQVNQRLADWGAEAIARAVDYLDRMDLAYAAADAAVCRAGSATVAELAHVRLPAVLVPYPHAPHDHQTRNAEELTTRGAAVMVPDAGLETQLADTVTALINDPNRLTAMRSAGAALAIPDAADRLAAWVLDLTTTSPADAPAERTTTR